jgi:hypothetical protein
MPISLRSRDYLKTSQLVFVRREHELDTGRPFLISRVSKDTKGGMEKYPDGSGRSEYGRFVVSE